MRANAICTKVSITIIKGISPIREALLASSSLIEQNLGSFSSFPIQHIIASIETQTFIVNPMDLLSKHVGDKVLANALAELEESSSKKIEFYQKPFGYILVIPVDENNNVAFAVENKWPYKILQVDWIDRSCNKAEEIPLPTDTASLINTKEMKDIYMKIKELKKT